MTFVVRRAAVVAAFVSALVTASCKPEEPPPPPPPPPAMALSPVVSEAAAAYLAYVRDAATIRSEFPDGQSIQDSLRRGASYESKSLARGTVAYAAIIALQEPTFVNKLREYAADPVMRQRLISQLYSDPGYATQLPGAPEAAGLVVATLQADGEAVYRVGTSVKQAAYDVQRQRWSREFIQNREGRLSQTKVLSATPVAASSEESARLMTAALSGTGLETRRGTPRAPYTHTVSRGLAIAALTALGAAGEDSQVSALLDEGQGAYCLNMAKLNLYQCLAVSKPHYEDVFCLGQHILIDTGQCITKVAGQLDPGLDPGLTVAQPVAPDALSASTQAVAQGSGSVQ